MTLPLEGVRIVEMGQLIAIPHAIKLLADMGAQVVRVESCVRLENYRTTSLYGNTTEGEYWNRGANFYEQNRNKLGLTLDLTRLRGLETLRELIGISDVFAENFTPRVMANFGLEYDDLRAIRPDIIMVSSTGYGYTGPWASFGAIGYTTEAASGLSHITGYRGGPPVLPEIPCADYTAAEHTAFAIMAALLRRARTGEGQFIDVSQAQAVSSTIPEALMDFTVNGRAWKRAGNEHTSMAPHGCYPCRGEDRWIAIAVATDEQWMSLRAVLGDPSWARDERFTDQIARWKHRHELDRLMSEATRAWDQHELMRALQRRGVAAGAVLDSRQLLFDPHLKARRFYEVATHHPCTGMPSLPYAGRPWKMSETPGGTRHAAPVMGEHNRYVLSEFLGASETELAALEEEGVTGQEPVSHQPLTPLPLEAQKKQGRIVDFDPDFERVLREEYGA